MIQHRVAADGSFSTDFSQGPSPEMVRAFDALERFAERNFPAEGRLKWITIHVDNLAETDRVLVLGGSHGDTQHSPGVYRFYFAFLPNNPGDVSRRAEKIETAKDLRRFVLAEDRFVVAASQVVDL